MVMNYFVGINDSRKLGIQQILSCIEVYQNTDHIKPILVLAFFLLPSQIVINDLAPERTFL